MKDQIKKTFKRFFEDKKTSLQTKALERANNLTKPLKSLSLKIKKTSLSH